MASFKGATRKHNAVTVLSRHTGKHGVAQELGEKLDASLAAIMCQSITFQTPFRELLQEWLDVAYPEGPWTRDVVDDVIFEVGRPFMCGYKDHGGNVFLGGVIDRIDREGAEAYDWEVFLNGEVYRMSSDVPALWIESHKTAVEWVKNTGGGKWHEQPIAYFEELDLSHILR